MLDLIPPDREVSIEREVFPKLVGNGLYGRRLEGYWIDIGTPERFLQANWDILEGRVETDRRPWTTRHLVEDGAEIARRAPTGRRARGDRRRGSRRSAPERRRSSESGPAAPSCRVGAARRLREAILGAGVEVAAGRRAPSRAP